MSEILFLPANEIQRIALDLPEGIERLELLADMCRFNALAFSKRAGAPTEVSGFGFLNLLTYLFYSEMNTLAVGISNPDSDVFICSSKLEGSGYFAVMYGLGLLSQEQFLNQALESTKTKPAYTSTSRQGSISHAIEIARSKQIQNHGGRVFFLTGADEWVGNQNVEALEAAVREKVTSLCVLINHSANPGSGPGFKSEDIVSLKHRESALGWHIARCDGQDYVALARVFDEFRPITDSPKILIADTINTRWISSLDLNAALEASEELYRSQADAPDDESFLHTRAELWERIRECVAGNALEPVTLSLAP